MANFICVTCGSQHGESDAPPAACRICDDERQYVGMSGQQWTTLEALSETHDNHLEPEEPGLWSLDTHPSFAIAPRALLIQHRDGNVLWDCLSLIDQDTADRLADLGGIAAIAISHPHFYASMVDWSAAFGDVPIFLHEADAAFVCRPDPRITFWSGDSHVIAAGLTLVRCGGHFEGSSILHWADGAEGRGALLTGDTVKVGWDRKSISVMRSYPNLIPVGPALLDRVESALAPWPYDRIYGAWPGHVIATDAPAIVQRSLARYRAAIRE